METTDFKEFIDEFNIVDNALKMRDFLRWNGRPIVNKENLSEHTHLVVACAIELYDDFYDFDNFEISFEWLIRLCMIHDSLEVLRGDILSVTKDAIPGLRNYVDAEEYKFYEKLLYVRPLELEVMHLADLKACYKFLERELQMPNNKFTIDAYVTCKKKYEDEFVKFCDKHDLRIKENKYSFSKAFVKGYKDDAGADVILKKHIEIMPMSTCTFDLEVSVTPKEGEMAVLCSRTSAAAKGLIVSMCPIDPNYNGHVMAIVHNVSNDIICYEPGEAFCQVVMIPINEHNFDYYVKKEGKRTDGRLGSTGK